MSEKLTADDVRHLRRCVELAREAVDAGDDPFGSILVNGDGDVLYEDRNREGAGDPTLHPEFAIAKWAAAHLTPAERATTTVYTSGEHCAMCSAAHGWVGLGAIVYASSTAQVGAWYREWGIPAAPVAPLAINEVVPAVAVRGPAEEFADDLRRLHAGFRGIPLRD